MCYLFKTGKLIAFPTISILLSMCLELCYRSKEFREIEEIVYNIWIAISLSSWNFTLIIKSEDSKWRITSMSKEKYYTHSFLMYFFIEGYLLYRILLFSVKPQHESAIDIRISPPFWNPLPSNFPSHPSRLIQSPCLSFRSHTANSRWLPILHMVM